MHWTSLGHHIVAQSRLGLVQHHQGVLWDRALLFFRGGSILFWWGFSFNCVEYIGVITNIFITCKVKKYLNQLGTKKLNFMAFRHRSIKYPNIFTFQKYHERGWPELSLKIIESILNLNTLTKYMNGFLHSSFPNCMSWEFSIYS